MAAPRDRGPSADSRALTAGGQGRRHESRRRAHRRRNPSGQAQKADDVGGVCRERASSRRGDAARAARARPRRRASDHVATARPRDERERPEEPVVGDDAPVRRRRSARARPSRAAAGRTAPSRRGGGSGGGAARPRRSTRPSSRSLSSPAIAREPGARVAERQAGPAARGRDRPPARGRRGSGGRAPRSAASRSTGCGSPSQSRTSTYACSRPTIGPRTASPRRHASISTWTSACPSVRTPAASRRSRSCSRVSGPSSASARSTPATPRSAAAGATPSCASRRALPVSSGGVVSACSHG